MRYPGRLIKMGETDARIVKALKNALNRALAREPALALDVDNPNFGPRMKQVVKLFQARHVDADGRPLKQDGEVGSLTWGVLFGAASVAPPARPTDPFLARVLRIAAAQEAAGVRERPPDSNRGPEVGAYLARIGLNPGYAWCCAFVYWCFDEAALALRRTNPMVRTGGCLRHWNAAPGQGARRIAAPQAIGDPSLLAPGMVFIMDHGRGLGHTGFVEAIDGGLLTTIEGNTDASRTREGGGVYRLRRKVGEINKGYIDYGGLVQLPPSALPRRRAAQAAAKRTPPAAARRRR
jgi:hypothetical protein